MASVHIPDEGRQAATERIMEQYGVDRSDPAMREAAETVAVRQEEAIQASQNRRIYG